MAYVFVVDDSPSVRALLAGRLRAGGHRVLELPDAETAAERATADPPGVVVTDLMMPGLSGVQLCRLLRGDPATAHVPVVLLTASGDKRSRFWARSAGAAAYVGKDRLDDAVMLVNELGALAPSPSLPPPAPRSHGGTLHERISSILDEALFESVLAGEVRALASGDIVRLAAGLAALLADVLTYRWVAVAPARPHAPVLVHGSPTEREPCEQAVRAALALPAGREVQFVSDANAVCAPGPPPTSLPVAFAGAEAGRMVVAPTGRGLSPADERLLALVAAELGGPLQMAALYEDARRLATTDTVTELLNRRAFLEALDRERARSDRHDLPLSLLMLDLDSFKQVNDTFGHAAGDVVLHGVARALVGTARRSDLIARWGGEEFVVALPQTGPAGARIAALRIRQAIGSARHVLPGLAEPIAVTASIGVASADAPWSSERLVAAADEAMYLAKARGRNRVEWAPLLEASTSVRRARLVESTSGREP
ncbi:MAG TPA: diguanylate cyclase [Polyangiaceae bacterium]